MFLQKQRFDVFSNPNVFTVLRAYGPARIVVYGVGLDVGDRHAVEGLLTLGDWDVWFVEDAATAIRPESVTARIEDWRRRGVRFVCTGEALELTR